MLSALGEAAQGEVPSEEQLQKLKAKVGNSKNPATSLIAETAIILILGQATNALASRSG